MIRALNADGRSVLAFELQESPGDSFTCPHCSQPVYLITSHDVSYFVHDEDQTVYCPLLAKYAGKD
jgi:hypothetical protein